MLLPQWLGEPLAVVTHTLAELNVQLGTSGLGSPGPTRPEVSLLILMRWKGGERFKRFLWMLTWYYPGLIFRNYNIWNFYFQVTKYILRAPIIYWTLYYERAMRFIVLKQQWSPLIRAFMATDKWWYRWKKQSSYQSDRYLWETKPDFRLVSDRYFRMSARCRRP